MDSAPGRGDEADQSESLQASSARGRPARSDRRRLDHHRRGRPRLVDRCPWRGRSIACRGATCTSSASVVGLIAVLALPGLRSPGRRRSAISVCSSCCPSSWSCSWPARCCTPRRRLSFPPSQSYWLAIHVVRRGERGRDSADQRGHHQLLFLMRQRYDSGSQHDRLPIPDFLGGAFCRSRRRWTRLPYRARRLRLPDTTRSGVIVAAPSGPRRHGALLGLGSHERPGHSLRG